MAACKIAKKNKQLSGIHPRLRHCKFTSHSGHRKINFIRRNLRAQPEAFGEQGDEKGREFRNKAVREARGVQQQTGHKEASRRIARRSERSRAIFSRYNLMTKMVASK